MIPAPREGSGVCRGGRQDKNTDDGEKDGRGSCLATRWVGRREFLVSREGGPRDYQRLTRDREPVVRQVRISVERLRQVGQKIFHVLKPDREADQVVFDADFKTFFR